jgi:flagellar protein FliT
MADDPRMSERDRVLLEHYESIAAASSRMLAAARAADWDAFLAHEQECARSVEALRALGGAPGRQAARRKAAIIRQVLAEDAEIRRLTQPWLEKLEALLRSGANQRRVDGAYR